MRNLVFQLGFVLGWSATALLAGNDDWPQWRGPTRDGRLTQVNWPADLGSNHLTRHWHIALGPSYSGPIVAGGKVFVTEARDQRLEIVRALDRATGRQLWQAEWEGYVKVPFFAKANGDWIRATPAFDEGRLYVAGMRDLLVCLDASTGEEVWRLDFVKATRSPVPAFGFVSSPLVAGDAVYVQAGAGMAKVDKRTGDILWRTLQDAGGMWGSAFSSPVLGALAGESQLVVQTREKLAGVHPADGRVLWEQPVKAFRGMNILTPTIWGDSVFTTAYGGKAHLFGVRGTGGGWRVEERWSARTEGYMCSPVVIHGHAYLHLRNERLACIELETGRERWVTDSKYGKYWSLVAGDDRILALDQRGILHLIRANPERCEWIDSRRVTEEESWAHLAVSGPDLFIRDMAGLTAWRWEGRQEPQPPSRAPSTASNRSR